MSLEMKVTCPPKTDPIFKLGLGYNKKDIKGVRDMSRKRFTMEQIIGLLREMDVKISQGKNVGQICRDIGISEQNLLQMA